MDLFGIAKRLEGLQTVASIEKVLGINRRTAINYLWMLRKKDRLIKATKYKTNNFIK